MREILHANVHGVTLVGTCHRPARQRTSASAPAVLLLNFGQVRRSGPRNLSAEMGDRLAADGYPVFRFDMPGLGDTVGDLPEYRETYWRFVEDGGHVKYVCGLLPLIRQQFRPSGFIVGGLCGGAVTAAYVADRNRTDVIGAVLMEPAVRHTPVVHSETMPGLEADANEGIWARLDVCLQGCIHAARLKTRNLRRLDPLRRTYRRLQRAISEMRGHDYPAMMNVPFIRSWQKLQAAAIPSLVLMAPGPDRDYIKNCLFPPKNRDHMEIVDMDDTNHLFIAGNGKSASIALVRQWMHRKYPLGGVAPERAECFDRAVALGMSVRDATDGM